MTEKALRKTRYAGIDIVPIPITDDTVIFEAQGQFIAPLPRRPLFLTLVEARRWIDTLDLAA